MTRPATRRTGTRVIAGSALAATLAAWLDVASAGSEAASAAPPAPGEVLRYDDVDRLRPWLPAEFWRHRRHYFYPGMQLEVGPARRDYSPADPYQRATRRFAGASRIGPDGSLEGYVAGQPFPMEGIDCAADPEAGVKIAWNYDHQWEGSGSQSHFRVTFLRRGRRLEGGFEGSMGTVQLANRVEEPLLARAGGDLFRGDRRKVVSQVTLSAPRFLQGWWMIFYRYKSSEGPLARAVMDDTWVYSPGTDQLQHYRTRHRSTPLQGAEVIPDDLGGFAGIVPQYEWSCVAETELLAPVNSRVRAYPYAEGHDFGPTGLSFASDRWELRPVVHVRAIAKDPEHPYARRDLYLDRQTLRVLYGFAYDRSNVLWKIIWHNGRFSEDDPDYYPGWEDVPTPRDAKTVADSVLNVQTGMGTRIEYWDNHGTPIGSKAEIKRFIDRRRGALDI